MQGKTLSLEVLVVHYMRCKRVGCMLLNGCRSEEHNLNCAKSGLVPAPSRPHI